MRVEERTIQKSHKLVINNRKASTVTGVIDVLSFDLNEILLETEQGMLMVKGSDLHVNLSGGIDSVAYSEVQAHGKSQENLFAKLFR